MVFIKKQFIFIICRYSNILKLFLWLNILFSSIGFAQNLSTGENSQNSQEVPCIYLNDSENNSSTNFNLVNYSLNRALKTGQNYTLIIDVKLALCRRTQRSLTLEKKLIQNSPLIPFGSSKKEDFLLVKDSQGNILDQIKPSKVSPSEQRYILHIDTSKLNRDLYTGTKWLVFTYTHGKLQKNNTSPQDQKERWSSYRFHFNDFL
ncbi:MAG: hypothetical protein HUU56_01410 [Bdellovibrionaceae bacterium]|nr:hypothetical protein [Pseudobdellovibrionaceae bacterium]